MKHFVFLFFLLPHFFFSQDLTGKWVTGGEMLIGDSFYEELHLVAGEDNQYFGHSFDKQDDGFCRYWLKATFSNEKFFGRENEKIKKTYSHRPVEFNLKYEKIGDQEFLYGTNRIYSMDSNIGINYESLSFVRYKKMSDVYKVYKEDDFIDPIIERNLDSIRIAKQIKEEHKQRIKDSIAREERNLLKIREEREDKVVGIIRVKNQKYFNIEIWDFGEEDNDIVTIIVNDSIIAKKITIKSEKQRFTVPIKSDEPNYNLIFVANNLGHIPPNSAKVRITYENKQHNFKLFTDEQSNAMIQIQNLDVSK